MYVFMNEVNNLISELFQTYSFKEKSKAFYKCRIESFFYDYMSLDINKTKPLNAITYYDINTYLKNLICADSERVNHYSALKRFFQFTYAKEKTNDIMTNVDKPHHERKPIEVLTDENYLKLRSFIANKDNSIYERLTLGLFLFTGLSRQYIASIRSNDFIYDNGVYKLRIWKNEEEVILPLKSELQLLINEYLLNLSKDEILKKVILKNDNALSIYITDLTKRLFKQKCTTTILSNTFISKALSSGNHIWEISKLTLESTSTIEKHIKDVESLSYKQTSILNSF
ncbi:MAG: hypothetical protein E6239_02210 [Clostridium perfringens]|nr:hypothetical protein [Clostridium perfringens]